MSIESNKAAMQKFVEFINTRDEAKSRELALEIVSEDATFFVPYRPEPLRGPDGYLEVVAMMSGAFPNIQWTLEETIAEGAKVAARYTMRGTHQGPFFGVPPSGKQIEVRAMNFYTFSDGKVIEEFGQPDLLGLMQQIGAIPA